MAGLTLSHELPTFARFAGGGGPEASGLEDLARSMTAARGQARGSRLTHLLNESLWRREATDVIPTIGLQPFKCCAADAETGPDLCKQGLAETS